MKDRIAKIRKDSEKTQDEFAEIMGISKNYVSLIENGKKTPSDRLISDICREFDVNEEWLRTGTGEMMKGRTRNQEIGAFANEVMDLPDGDFKKRFIEALIKLDSRDWETIQKIVDSILKKEGQSPSFVML